MVEIVLLSESSGWIDSAFSSDTGYDSDARLTGITTASNVSTLR